MCTKHDLTTFTNLSKLCTQLWNTCSNLVPINFTVAIFDVLLQPKVSVRVAIWTISVRYWVSNEVYKCIYHNPLPPLLCHSAYHIWTLLYHTFICVFINDVAVRVCLVITYKKLWPISSVWVYTCRCDKNGGSGWANILKRYCRSQMLRAKNLSCLVFVADDPWCMHLYRQMNASCF